MHTQINRAPRIRHGMTQLFFQHTRVSRYPAYFRTQQLQLVLSFGRPKELEKLRISRNCTKYAGQIPHICCRDKYAGLMLFPYHARLQICPYRRESQFQCLVAVVYWKPFTSHPLKRNIFVETHLLLGLIKQHGDLFVIKRFLDSWVVMFFLTLSLLTAGLQSVCLICCFTT